MGVIIKPTLWLYFVTCRGLRLRRKILDIVNNDTTIRTAVVGFDSFLGINI